MRIALEKLYPTLLSGSKARKTASSAPAERSGQSYDAISISHSSWKEDDVNFAAKVSHTLSEKVHTAPSEERLNQLKDQIDHGLYQVDADAIATKILYVRG